MGAKKKAVRKAFRTGVFSRDRYRCVVCGRAGLDRQGGNDHLAYHQEDGPVDLDAHHITNRDLMPNGGYVPENGITLCPDCHIKAEAADPGFLPEDLYGLIGSSHRKAVAASEKL